MNTYRRFYRVLQGLIKIFNLFTQNKTNFIALLYLTSLESLSYQWIVFFEYQRIHFVMLLSFFLRIFVFGHQSS